MVLNNWLKYCHLSPSSMLFFLLFHEAQWTFVGLVYLDLFFIDKVDPDDIFPEFDGNLHSAS